MPHLSITRVSFLQTLVGTLPVQEVLYNDTRGILMIVLATGASRAQLEALNPDLQLLQSRLIDDHLSGVAVTCQGMRPSPVSLSQ